MAQPNSSTRDATAGLYRKYHVERTDGSSGPGGKHEHCDYFVLDLVHDKLARDALETYTKAAEREYPLLADDLYDRLAKLNRFRVCTPPHRRGEQDAECSEPPVIPMSWGLCCVAHAKAFDERYRASGMPDGCLSSYARGAIERREKASGAK